MNLEGRELVTPYEWMKIEKFAEFLEDRKIAPSDYSLINNLTAFPPEEFITLLHNHFNTYHERSLQELDAQINFWLQKPDQAAAQKKISLLQNFKVFAEKYDWATCYNLERILEDRT